MSCDNSTCSAAVVDLDLCSSPTIELGTRATARKTDLEADKGPAGVTADRTKSKECRHEVPSRAIPDCTKTDPEFVWGDEGQFND